MADFTFQDVLRFIAVLGALCGLAAALWAGVEAAGKLSGKPRRDRDRERLADLEARLSRCESRLRQGDRRFSDMRADLTQTLMVLNALLMHEITGNSIDNLKSVKSGLDSYLSGRQRKEQTE